MGSRTFQWPAIDLFRATPSFEDDKTNLLKAGDSTSIILIDDGIDIYVSTGFFIGPSTLLTAGHCVAPAVKPGARLVNSVPGLPIVDLQKLRNGEIGSAKCSVKASLHRSRLHINKDIAILESGYISPSYLDISKETLEPNKIVDIIGYPGNITDAWLLKHHGITSANESRKIAEQLLPTRHLTISRGNVVDVNSTMTYTVSTCRGMSGACVLSGGKAYGIQLPLNL